MMTQPAEFINNLKVESRQLSNTNWPIADDTFDKSNPAPQNINAQ
jgi:hypothetical protein